MRLTFLGSGDAFCDWRVNYHNNAVVHVGETVQDGVLMVDCGMTAVQSLKELGGSTADVQALVLTHVHADHASAANLLVERFYGADGGPHWRRTRVVAPPSVLQALRDSLAPLMAEAHLPPDVQPHETRRTGIDAALEVVPLPAGARWVHGCVGVRFFEVPHVDRTGLGKPAYGVELDQDGVHIVWSSDTTFRADWIAAQAARPEVARIFHDCTFRPWFPQTVHTHFSELSTLPDAVKARITLMHHVAVPDGVDISAFAGAAARHQGFAFSPSDAAR